VLFVSVSIGLSKSSESCDNSIQAPLVKPTMIALIRWYAPMALADLYSHGSSTLVRGKVAGEEYREVLNIV